MKTTLFGAVVGALVVAFLWSFLGREAPVFAQRSTVYDASAELITVPSPVDNNRQQLTVIDPRNQVMAVYHTDLATGGITLKSVRNIHWDLQMPEFNGTSPLPSEIRKLMEAPR